MSMTESVAIFVESTVSKPWIYNANEKNDYVNYKCYSITLSQHVQVLQNVLGLRVFCTLQYQKD